MASGDLVPVGAGALRPWQPPQVGPVGPADQPFDDKSLELLDEVIAEAELTTGLRFSAYIGDLGENTRAGALELLGGLKADSPYAVLLALSPGQRVVEVVTGVEAARRVTDRAARLAVLGVASAAQDGDLLGALMNGLRTLADQAGTLPHRSGW